KQIPYRKVSLTREGAAVDEATPVEFIMKAAPVPGSLRKRKRTRKAPAVASPDVRPASDGDSRLEEALRTWRLKEAQRRGLPAFRIFTDKVLKALAAERPATAR